MKTLCSIDDCTARAHARGWCNKHYLRWFFHGDPMTTKLIKNDDQRRFWSKVDQGDSTGCWPWLAARDKDGYGSVWFQRRQWRAPRVAWILANNRPIPDGQVVRHSCDNPPCVNPAHLELGTSLDNDQDRTVRGRSARGTANGGGTKLTEEAVLAIRKAAVAGRSRQAIAADYGVNKKTIGSVLTGRTWGWVR